MRTEVALRAFQAGRGLVPDGICDEATWAALVEAGYHLGDRLLYQRTPMVRGDDVAELQQRLGMLGFDAGRVDGILGPSTARALMDFQANAGLRPDGICGHETLAVLDRLGSRTVGEVGVAQVREREALLHSPRTLRARRLVLGEFGGLGALIRATRRALAEAGADVVTLDDPDGSRQAAAANAFGAEVYIGLALHHDPCQVAYYAATGFESAGGRRLAELIQTRLPAVLGQEGCPPRGMRLPILRETRMPAVWCELGPPRLVVRRTWLLARELRRVLTAWCATPVTE